MLTALEGVYRNGRVELLETPANLEGAHVIVTFLPLADANLPPNGQVDLVVHGINEEQAFELRSRLQTFTSDWSQPEMDAYDAL